MDFRTVAGKSVRRPIDVEDLPSSDLSLSGPFVYSDCQAEDVDQSAVVGQGSLHHVVVSQSSLAESRFTELELSDVALRHVAVSNASWEQASARRVEVVGCQAIGLRLGLVKAEDLYLEDCKLDYARVDVERQRGVVVFHRCTFREATLGGDLSGMVFSECEFAGAEFQARRAVDCDMTSSRLVGASGLLTLAGASITEDQAVTLAGQLAAEVGFVIS
ncbi:hypothetical protein EV193_102175 [Herbihabitans rhizosphaerae]|uniref:Pentapeptide repeat protein n=1 Tax=Herbihabitans rhizosphaerae TaxID=1872711 RepID=A0A4Q7L283_9PSEU|nr:pentapeptide repeat-containing protein [Herbihabitans rhizosphaerae]RZS43196.1 hypothetical protein EV193_102175 [Herbihabitans rhizosphaerae]